MKHLYILIFLFLTACNTQPHFWYPETLYNAECSTFRGDVYRMTNSRGWRSWPYFLEPTSEKEIILPQDCTLIVIKEFKTYKKDIMNKINAEQKKYRIPGF